MQVNNNTSEQYLPVVIGQGSYNDLGIIRSLGEKGIKSVYLTDGEHIIPIRKSRYLLETIIANFEDNLSASIQKIASEYGKRLVLFPSSDAAACTLDKNHRELSSIAIVPHAEGRLEHLMDKGVQAGMALQTGFVVPASATFHIDTGEVPVGDIHLPCIVKPLLSIKGSKSHITVCRTKAELEACIQLFKDNKEYHILIQDFVEQAGLKELCITGVAFEGGQVAIGGMVEKYRSVGNGSTSYGRFSPDMPDSFKMSVAQLVEQTNYNGLFDIECFVTQDGRLVFIECNFRNGAYGYAATRAGVNLPLQYYLGVQGMKSPAENVCSVKFMEERVDFLNVKMGKISFMQWLRDAINADVLLYANIHDIGPMIRIPHFIKK